MEFLELKNISERHLDLLNPTTPEKILAAGRVAGMGAGRRVIDFGCGYAEPLILWARAFNISGVGIDIRPFACEKARQKIAAQGLEERIQVVCANACEYAFEPHSYDIATCIGATFCWEGGFQEAIRSMKTAIPPRGSLIVGEVHWLTSNPPPEVKQLWPSFSTEYELLTMAHTEGLELTYVLHSNHDDWDHYESENLRGLADWLEENPAHAEREEVIRHLHESQEEYLRFEREFYGWALYVLKPGS